MTRSASSLLLVRLLGSVWSLVALSALLAAIWMPYVYHANTPVRFGSGVVQESTRSEVDVVLLDSGEYTTLDDDSSYQVGERVEVYDTAWSAPTASPSEATLWVLTVLAGVLGLGIATLFLGFFGSAAFGALESYLMRRSR